MDIQNLQMEADLVTPDLRVGETEGLVEDRNLIIGPQEEVS